jgi:hypothetical protein
MPDPEVVWHVCGTRMVHELIRPALHSVAGPVTWAFWLERAKGIEPS